MSADIQIFSPTCNNFSDAAGVRVRVGGDHGDVCGLGVRGGRGGLRGPELGHGDGGQLLERLVPVPAPLLPHRGAHARGIRGTHVDISTKHLYYLLRTGSCKHCYRLYSLVSIDVQVNLIFLLNIVRILVSKLQADSTPNVAQVR